MDELNRHARTAIDAELGPGEKVEVVIAGPSNQAVIGTDRRVFVFKKGFMAGATLGSELTSFDYRNLNGVQIHTGMMSGAVVISAAGHTGTKTNTWKNGDSDPYKAPNAIPVTRPYDNAKAGVAQLRQLIAAHHQGPPTAAASAPLPATTATTRVAAEIAGLAELHRDGALTDAEFSDLKAAVLQRLRVSG